MPDKHIYRITFVNQDKVYEIYARQISQGGMFGFVEVEKLEFGTKSEVVVDPSEERLKDEFADVSRTYIPMHSIIRIDEVKKTGHAKIMDGGSSSGKVMPFPIYTPGNKG
ncbi:MAG: DUF1820 family protein [Nevskiales bacterium]